MRTGVRDIQCLIRARRNFPGGRDAASGEGLMGND